VHMDTGNGGSEVLLVRFSCTWYIFHGQKIRK
jgi:hypothetical protein